MPWPAPASRAEATSRATDEACTAAISAPMLRVVLMAPAVRMVRRRSFCTANWTPVAARNMTNAMAPETIRLVVPSSSVSRVGPSDSTKDVAVMPGANTAMPRARWMPLPCGTPGTRTQAPLPRAAGRRTGMRSTARTAVASRTASTTKTVTVGAGSASDSRPASSGPRPAPKTMAQEASSAASRLRSGPATSVTAAMPAETTAPTAMPVNSRAMISAATVVAVAKIAQAARARPRAGSSTGLRPSRSETTPETSSEPSSPTM